MATRRTINAGFGRSPGRVREGSPAFFRKQAIGTARASMAAVLKRYEAFVRNFQDVTPDVLRNALQPVFDKSQEYVPVRTGDLKDSGVITVTSSHDRTEGEITYGNAQAWYAALVHEYVWLNHAPPTRAKYLQSAMEEELDNFMTSIALDYSIAMGR